VYQILYLELFAPHAISETANNEYKQKLETKANETLLNVQIVFVYNAPPTILNQNRFDVQMWTYVELKRKYLVNQLQFCPLRYVVE